MSNIAKLSYI